MIELLHCYYCNNECDATHSTDIYVKPTFTNRDIIARPGSKYICGDCLDSFNEKTTVELIDGEVRNDQRIRLYSWIITKEKRVAATKAHISILRGIILNPPEPPFTIVLADSGQKHLLFRSKKALSREYFPVMLEEEIIYIRPRELEDRINLLIPLIAATGKPALADRCGTNFAIRLFEMYGDWADDLLDQFTAIQDEPLTRLALWLSPNKQECTEHERVRKIVSGRVPEENSGSGKSDRNKKDGSGKSEKRSSQIVDDTGQSLFG